MPRINDKMEAHKMPDNFGYSAVGIKDLGATEYTLATIVCDRSGSVAAFQKELEKCIKEVDELYADMRKNPGKYLKNFRH